MKRLLATIGLALVMLTACQPDHTPNVTTTTRCVEDDPCWNCATMGNHLCGPQS